MQSLTGLTAGLVAPDALTRPLPPLVWRAPERASGPEAAARPPGAGPSAADASD